ncbi:MAG: hypothetical protein EOO54_02065 [Haliea sp.]|nr:MAG: hypothetical protein EOO54_02065 [Haliea sp.]
MRARLVFIVLAILAVAGFAALNWSEFLRTTPLSFGLVVMEAPLGLILLGMLTITLLAFIISSALMQTQGLLENRDHAKAMAIQRELADKAEASRFTELRQYLDAQVRETRQREAIAATEFERAMVQSQRELRTQLEQMDRTLLARLAQLESRTEVQREQPLLARRESLGSS